MIWYQRHQLWRDAEVARKQAKRTEEGAEMGNDGQTEDGQTDRGASGLSGEIESLEVVTGVESTDV